MTLITISHLPGEETGASPPNSLQLHHQASCGTVSGRLSHRQHQHQHQQQHSEVDRFSLNSNLSDSSPHSSLASPLSTEYNGSQASICYTSSNASTNQDHDLQPEDSVSDHLHHHHHHSHHQHHHQRKLSHHHSCLLVPAQYSQRKLSEQHHHRQALSLTQPSIGEEEAILVGAGQQQVVVQASAPVRKLSRTEHRQSLSDLGYGKIESYTKLQRLGKGTYATVYMGRSRLSNDLVALKEILKEHDEGAPCTAIREVSLLRLLRHNNIVTLHDICHTPKKLTLVFEYVGPDLYAYMKENNHLLSIHNIRVSKAQQQQP